MITQHNDVVEIDSRGLVRICAWCVPLVRRAELHRQYPAMCTDGLCPACRETLEREVA